MNGTLQTGGRQSLWPGVDFLLQSADDTWIWLETKNWEPLNLLPRRHGVVRRRFLAEMHSKSFWNGLRDKFIGTTAFLALTGPLPDTPIIYVSLLESKRLDSALKSHANRRMRERLPQRVGSVRWAVSFTVVVLDVEEWNARFPEVRALTR